MRHELVVGMVERFEKQQVKCNHCDQQNGRGSEMVSPKVLPPRHESNQPENT